MAQKQIHFDDLEVKAHSVTLSATDGDVLLNRTEAGGDGSVIVSSGSIVAANEDNLVAVNGDGSIKSVSAPDARTALGLGSAATQNSSAFATAAQGGKADTALQPGTADGSGVQHDGTVIMGNAGQLTEVDSNGKVKSSGKSFGATIFELQRSANPNKVASLADLPFSWINFREIALSSFNAAETTGTGTASVSNFRFIDLNTGADANSVAALIRRFSAPGWSRANRAVINGNRRSVWHLRGWLENWTPAAEVNMICIGRGLGGGTGNEVGPLKGRGFGWRVKAGTAGDNTLYALYKIDPSLSTGAEIEIDTGQSFDFASRLNNFLTIEVVGDGTINWFENGALLASVNNFGTGAIANFSSGFDITNGTDAAVAQFRLCAFNTLTP